MGKIIIEPYLLALQESSVIIAWEMDQDSNYSFKYKCNTIEISPTSKRVYKIVFEKI